MANLDSSLLPVSSERAGSGRVGTFLLGAATVAAICGPLSLAQQALAAPPVPLEASRATVPVQSFLAEANPDHGPDQGPLVSDLGAVYPIRTPGLVPGRLKITTAGTAKLSSGETRWLMQPMVLVGDDASSHIWLNQQCDALVATGAIVLVVRVESPARMSALRTAHPELPMAPAALNDVAAKLRVAGAGVLPLAILPGGHLTQDLRNLAGQRSVAGSQGGRCSTSNSKDSLQPGEGGAHG